MKHRSFAPLLPNGAVDYELSTAVEGILLPIELRDIKGGGDADNPVIATMARGPMPSFPAG